MGATPVPALVPGCHSLSQRPSVGSGGSGRGSVSSSVGSLTHSLPVAFEPSLAGAGCHSRAGAGARVPLPIPAPLCGVWGLRPGFGFALLRHVCSLTGRPAVGSTRAPPLLSSPAPQQVMRPGALRARPRIAPFLTCATAGVAAGGAQARPRTAPLVTCATAGVAPGGAPRPPTYRSFPHLRHIRCCSRGRSGPPTHRSSRHLRNSRCCARGRSAPAHVSLLSSPA
jgi:hypothetical protein